MFFYSINIYYIVQYFFFNVRKLFKFNLAEIIRISINKYIY